MKNKTSILVRTRHFFYALLVAVIFCGCNVPNDKEYSKIKEQDFSVITIDSCEYIFMSEMPIDGNMALSHKGNCKFCEQRSKK